MTSKKLSSIAITIMLMLSIAAVFTVSPALAAEPYIAVKPVHTVFATPVVGNTFSVYINVSSTVGFAGYQVYLYWDRTYINATGFVETPPAAWTPFGTGVGIDWDYNATHGKFVRAVLDTHTPLLEVTGTFTVERIDFQIIDVPKAPADPDALIILALDPVMCKLSDDTGTKIIPFFTYNGDVFLASLAAPPATIYVDPYETYGTLGVNFTVDIKIKDLDVAHNIFGWQFIMYYNTTLLDTVDITEGPFLKSFATPFPNGTLFLARFDGMYDPSYVNTTYEQEGKIVAACLLYGDRNAIPAGAGTLATITFTPTLETIAPETAWCWLDIGDNLSPHVLNGSTLLADHPEDWPPKGEVPHNRESGKYYAPVRSIGRNIDSFTDSYRKYLAPTFHTTFTGKYPQVNADAYEPQDLVTIYALVTYGDDPVQNKPVQFEVRPRDKYTGEERDVIGFPLYRVALTNATGIANITFRIPWPCDDPYSVMGGWYVYQSVDIACEKVVDEEWFEVAWYIWLGRYKGAVKLPEVTPDPAHKYPVCQQYANVTFWFENHALTPLHVYFTVVLYDHQLVPIGMKVVDMMIPAGVWCNPYDGSQSVLIHIPKWAFVGSPTPDWQYPVAYVNAYTFRCSECGMPYCPEVSDTFAIAK